MMKDAAGVREVSLYVYDNWAKRHMKDGQWEMAADVYVKGLAAYPGEGLLRAMSRISRRSGRRPHTRRAGRTRRPR